MNNQPRLTREQVRNVDRIAIEELGLPGIALMENAGRGTAEILLNQPDVRKVVICAAGGNNGGDGFVVARHLMLAGCDVEVWLFSSSEKLSGDALTNYQVTSRLGIPITECDPAEVDDSLEEALNSADWIVDALFGTGLDSEVRPPYDQLIDRINQVETPVLAVDLPSGLDCDTGQPLGTAIRAAMTATFVAEKVGFAEPGASEWTGKIEVVSIGVPWDLAAC
ncbi:MAG: NAD(P)H-hydrate epimerase [Planctomycetaceae bacterium]|nr:NAD(P)H-hydrate epimerase [Planctomycetaceae bacterium]